MEADEVLKLLDVHWFERGVFTHVQNAPLPRAKYVQQVQHKTDQEYPKLRKVQNLQVRSLSDRYLGVNPNDFFFEEKKVPKLEKILSGIQVTYKEEKTQARDDNKRRNQKNGPKPGMMTRSLSALEFEEVKGFIDLGFVFTDEDKVNSNLVSVIPGLTKWNKMAYGDDNDDGEMVIKEKVGVSRPYLSEAWSTKKQVINMMNWKIPSHVNNEVNMKDHLRVWAHNVASTVI